MKRALSIIAAAWMGSQLLACSIGDPDGGYSADMTFEEFEAVTYKEPWEGGAYIVDGDTMVPDRKGLYEFWDKLFHPNEGGLIVNRVGGVDDKWNDTQKLNITYCVSNTFNTTANPTRKAVVVEALRQATDLGWETLGNVNFIYRSDQDATCTASNTNVVFDVRPVNVGGQYLARAFFPSNARSSRNVLIDNTAFSPTLTWPLKNILIHELGHALGFRHEHTRPESGTCFEDSNWRSLTPYDSASTMHYPQCNGTSSDLRLTARDGEGIAALYGAPGSPPPPPPTGVARTQTWSGSLAQNRTTVVQLSPALSVVAGSNLTVNMTGTGDADLYVRFGGAPTLSVYNCRPYTGSSTESCNLTVPSGTTTAYVGVVGYTASTYNITANYLAPQ